MKLYASCNITLPNGKRIKVGETFEYDGDVRPLKGAVCIIREEKKVIKVKKKEEDHAG